MKTYMFHFLIFYSISFVQTQLLPFLTTVGYSMYEKAILLASSAFIALSMQFYLGYKTDTSTQYKRYYMFIVMIFFISACCLYTWTISMFFIHIVLVAITGGFVKVIMGYDETWMLADKTYAYGKLRAMGSLGFTIGAISAGYVMHQNNHMLTCLMLCVIGLLFLYLLSFQQVNFQHQCVTSYSWKKFIQNKAYIQMIVALTIVYFIGSADQFLVIDKLQELGATRQQIGIKWATQAVVEVPILLYSSKIFQKYSNRSCLLFGMLMFGIKFFLYGFVSSVEMIIVVATLQIVTLPLIMVASKRMIQKLCPAEMFASAQLIATAIFTGASMLCSPFVCSYLYHYLGIDQALYALSASMMIPFLLILCMKKANKNMFVSR